MKKAYTKTETVYGKPLAELAAEHGMNYGTVHSRIRSGWTLREALNTPPGGRPVAHRPVNPDSLQQIAKRNGIHPGTFHGRVRRFMAAGMTREEAIEEALSFDPEAVREAQRKYHTEEERKAAHREAARRHYRKKRATLAVRDTVERIHEAETKARKEALKQLRKDIRERWFASPEYLRLRQRRQEESREAAHDERKFIREALKGMILECPPGAERELAQWMLDHLDDDVLRVRQVDEFLGTHAGV